MNECLKCLEISRACLIASVVILLSSIPLFILAAISCERRDFMIAFVVVLCARLPVYGCQWALRRCREAREEWLAEMRESFVRDLAENGPEEEQESEPHAH